VGRIRQAGPVGFILMAMMQPAAQDRLERGVLPASWPTGASCPETPVVRVHEYNANFYILRQSACTNFEKPFLYLLFGGRAALLVDTGAKTADVRGVVQGVMSRWSAAHDGRALPLIVVHSHGHGDHTAGDAQFAGAPDTTLVPATVDALKSFFHIERWPDETVTYDLGDRPLEIVPIPGHEVASIAIYDRRTGILLTGDTLYPGRLYVRDDAAFRASVARLVAFSHTSPIAHALGAHIENTRTPFVDYPEGTINQAEEHVLELGRSHLLELDAALREMQGPIARRALRDFTIWPVGPRPPAR
jgi:hydroxyacylglutathione hydrolase